jgi:hypothetical protein
MHGDAMDRKTQGEKLSARIIAIATPWIERLGPAPTSLALRFVYETCGAVWNVSRLQDATARETLVGDFRKGVVSAAPSGTENEVRRMFDLLYQRALVAWPEDRRFVARVTVVDVSGGNFRLDVVSVTGHDGSTPIPPDSRRFPLRDV